MDSSPRCGVVFPFVPSPVTSPSAAEAARGGEQEGRLRLDEEVLDANEELRQPVVGVGGTEEEQDQERLDLCTPWHTLLCRVFFYRSHDLSHVHWKGDLGDEVDGMQRERRRRLQRVPEAFERCRCAHDVHSCFVCATRLR